MKPLPTCKQIVAAVAHFERVPLSDLNRNHDKGVREISPRQIAMYLCRHIFGHTCQASVDAVGLRQHGSTLHAIKCANRLMDRDDVFRSYIIEIVGFLDPAAVERISAPPRWRKMHVSLHPKRERYSREWYEDNDRRFKAAYIPARLTEIAEQKALRSNSPAPREGGLQPAATPLAKT